MPNPENNTTTSPRNRIRDHLRPKVLVRDRKILTGHPMRDPITTTLQVADPDSGQDTAVVMHHFPARQTPQARIVAVHGFRGDYHGLQLIIDALPDVEFWVPDLPGFGLSPALVGGEHSVQNFADVVGQVREQTITDRDLPVWLMGHSFGSLIASFQAAGHPDSWSGLILLNPISRPALDPAGPISQRAMTRATSMFYSIAAALPTPAARWLLSHPAMVWATGAVMGHSADPHVIGYTHEQHQEYFSAFDHPGNLRESYQASISATVHDVADQLKLPTLLLAGAHDELATVEEQQQLTDHIRRVSPATQLAVLEDTGHLMHYEVAPEVARHIRRFIGSRHDH